MPNDPRRFVALVIEFPNEEELTKFQRAERGFVFSGSLVGDLGDEAIDCKVHEHTYPLELHPHAPYIYDMTVKGLHL